MIDKYAVILLGLLAIGVILIQQNVIQKLENEAQTRTTSKYDDADKQLIKEANELYKAKYGKEPFN